MNGKWATHPVQGQAWRRTNADMVFNIPPFPASFHPPGTHRHSLTMYAPLEVRLSSSLRPLNCTCAYSLATFVVVAVAGVVVDWYVLSVLCRR